MVSISASYIYTFAAITAVTTLLMFSFVAYANTLRVIPEMSKLKKLLRYVASKAIELLTLSSSTNVTLEIYLEMPVTIGNREYWVQLRNDSSNAWVEGGFGKLSNVSSGSRVYFPQKAHASGHYIGGNGALIIRCWMNNTLPSIILNGSGGQER